MTLTWLPPLRQGGEARLVLSGAAAFAGIVWTVTRGSGTLTPTSTHADAAGIASARYQAADAAGDTVEVTAAAYA